nr:translation initiation factor IF-2-like [Symphalangus syndactylus]
MKLLQPRSRPGPVPTAGARQEGTARVRPTLPASPRRLAPLSLAAQHVSSLAAAANPPGGAVGTGRPGRNPRGLLVEARAARSAGPVRAGARPMEAAPVLSSRSLPFPGVGARGPGAGRRRLPPREAAARAVEARPGGSRGRGSPAQESPAHPLRSPRSRSLSGRSRHQLCPRRSRARRGEVARLSPPPDPGHRVAPERRADAGPWGAAEAEDPREGGARGRLQPQTVFSVSPDQVIQMSCNGDINS